MTDIIHNRKQLGSFRVVKNHHEILGKNYLQIHERITSMKDTFGLCGILSSHISCLWANPSLWANVSYNPKRYKSIFDKAIAKGLNKTGVHAFWDERKHLITPNIKWLKIQSVRSFKIALNRAQKDNLSLRIALICEYEFYNGRHTHWLACKKIDNKNVLLAGDLTPFGLTEPAIELPIKTLTKALSKVIGHPINTSLFNRLKQSDYSQSPPVFPI